MSRPSILRSGLLGLLMVAGAARLAPAFEPPNPIAAEEPAGTAAAHGAEEAHVAKDPDILEPSLSLMIATVAVFLTLLAVLWRFAWGPLTLALAERERKQEETIRAAEEAKAESARLLQEHRRQMDAAAEQVRQILEDARRQADANAQTIVTKAQAEAEASRERAEREIGTAKDQALSEIWGQTADLAVSVAGKVLAKEMSGDDHRRLVESAMGELPAANGHGNGRGGMA